MILVLFGLTLLIFTLLKTMPGDPARAFAGIGATQATIEGIREQMGLNEPLPVQYWRLFSGLFTGEVQAMTFRRPGPVWEIIWERLPATVELGFFGLLIAILVSVPAGLLSAIYRNTPLDYGVTTAALMGISIPVFWFALMLMIVFGVYLQWLPVSGRGDSLWGWSFLTLDGIRHLIIPSVALASVQMALNARLTRASMLEVMRQDYVTTARSKGLREYVVLIKHAFRNAMAPVVTNVGLQIGTVFAGAVLTETTTAWPGLGRLMVDAILRRDQAVVFALTLFLGMIFMVSYLVVDLFYAYIDPRITYD
ncbi:MAG: ABC transporter permease [Candidatus Bipolaricaulota bacterium]|nr:MAG: ABC transporter permease [Candidatus Bipolaricaulota bacterium]